MTAPGMEKEPFIQEEQEAEASSLLKPRRRFLMVLGIIVTVMFFRHPAALSGRQDVFCLKSRSAE